LFEELEVEELDVGVELLDGLPADEEAGFVGEEVVVVVELADASFFCPSVVALFSPSDGGFSLLE